MKNYIVKEDYIDNFVAEYIPGTLIDEMQLKQIAEGCGMSIDELMEQVEEAENRAVYVARSANDNTDAIKVFFDKAEAVKAAEMFSAHLTAAEKKKNTVSVERYTVAVATGRTAQAAYHEAIMADAVGDPEEYEVVE